MPLIEQVFHAPGSAVDEGVRAARDLSHRQGPQRDEIDPSGEALRDRRGGEEVGRAREHVLPRRPGRIEAPLLASNRHGVESMIDKTSIMEPAVRRRMPGGSPG